MKKAISILLTIMLVLAQVTLFAEPATPTPGKPINNGTLHIASAPIEADRAATQTKWTVTNQSGQDITFTYQVGTATGSLTIPAVHTNQNQDTNPFYFYAEAPHPATATIKWGDELQYSKSATSAGQVISAPPAPTPDPTPQPSPDATAITLTAMGIEVDKAATQTKWRLINNFGHDLNFTWQVYGTEITGTGTLPKEHTNEVRFDNPYYLYIDAPHPATLVVKWGTDNQFKTQKASSGQVIYPPLTTSSLGLTAIPVEGNKAGQTKWRVVNNYGYPVTFNWNIYGTSHTGTLTIPANHTNDNRFSDPFYFYAPVAHPATMKITWGPESQFSATKASNPEILPYPTSSSLVLTSMDIEEVRSGTETKWRVINKFGQPLTFTYTVAGRPEITGTHTIGAEHTEAARFDNPFYFYLPVPHPATVIITWGDLNEFKTTKASGGKIILDREPTIELKGLSTITLPFGTPYTELGATATDHEDGDLEVKIEGTVNSDQADTYTITYSAKDKMNHTVSITRRVIVEAQVTTQTPPATTQTPPATTQTPPATTQAAPETTVAPATTQATPETTVVPATTAALAPATTQAPAPTIAIEEITVPQGNLQEPSTETVAIEAQGQLTLDESVVPQGAATLPQTGETNYYVFYLLGIAIMTSGAWLLKK